MPEDDYGIIQDTIVEVTKIVVWVVVMIITMINDNDIEGDDCDDVVGNGNHSDVDHYVGDDI